MKLRRRQPGDYSGSALYTIEGLWVVSVSQYRGWTEQEGYLWRGIPAEGFFRLDVLRRQVAAKRLPFEVSFRDGRCLFKPVDRRGNIGLDGGRIKRFMNKHYATFGQPKRPVEWSWEVRQYN